MNKIGFRAGVALVVIGICAFVPALAADLFFAGDSTLESCWVDGRKREPYRSWGDSLQRKLKSGNKVRNFARSGYSTKMFIERGAWKSLIAEVKAGDFVVIQFGHNDQKHTTEEQVRTLYAPPNGAYRENLRNFAAEVRAKGATPVFCTPIVRATFDDAGKKLVDTTWAKDGITLATYAQAVRATGAELGVDVVDMNRLTGDLCEKVGRDEAYRFFVISTGLIRGKDGEPAKDVTHPIQRGADAFAELFLADVRARKLTVASLFAEELPGFRNGDFEAFDEKGKTVGWYAPRPFQIVRGAGSNGSCGAVYEVTEPGKADGHLSQRVPVVPGAIYTFGAWAKAENVGGRGPAFVVIGFRDANGKWLSESRSTAVRKSTDGWIKLEGLSRPAPTNAVTAGVAIVVQDTLTGRFAFDKVYFERHMPRPVAGIWCDAYRNEATDGEVSFAAALSPQAFGAKPADVKAIFAVLGSDGSKFSVTGTMPSADEARVTIPVDRFPIGTNEVVCALKAGERLIGKARMTFVRTATPTPRKVSFDRYGRTVVDGKLVFPYGMYTGRTFFEGTNFERYCEAPFNCFMEYGHPTKAELDRCAKAGIWSIQNIAAWYGQPDAGTNSVRQMMKVKDHPALLGWYMFDEQPISMVPILEARYRYVVENDPHHPVWCAQDIPGETRHYLGSIDAFGCDPYPVSTRPVSMATDWIRTERRQLMGMRPIWQVVQFFGWNWHDPKQAHQRRPTEAELRNMTWQAIAGGARGLIYYAYGYLCTHDELAGEKSADIWEELKRVAREVKAHERVLLFAETEDVPGLPEGVVGRVFRENGETWTLLVNTTEKPIPSLGLAPLEVRMKP